ncbi:hypothetical protein ACFTZ8_09700 [Streptomyces fungicidicus]|uniref:hypothetical protein n=1 Tax=Streptomyces fungicidicus TaxID=68203 RepID=UPI0034066A58
MSRRHRPPAAPDRHLMAHLRNTVWGPAEFVGLPPWWLTAKGLLAGCLAAAAITGSALAGAWYGLPVLADGEGGLVCAAGVTLYLWALRAGRALVGTVAVLAVCLALLAPHAAVDLVLAARGRVAPALVTSVERAPGTASGKRRYLCSVSRRDGVPLEVRVWRGCGRSTRPGDALAVVYDSEGRVPPQGVAPGAARSGSLPELGGLAAALVAGCLVAVVRSHRLSPATGTAGPP